LQCRTRGFGDDPNAASGIRVQNHNMSTVFFLYFCMRLYLCLLLTPVGYFLDLVRSITSFTYAAFNNFGVHINWLILHATLWEI